MSMKEVWGAAKEGNVPALKALLRNLELKARINEGNPNGNVSVECNISSFLSLYSSLLHTHACAYAYPSLALPLVHTVCVISVHTL